MSSALISASSGDTKSKLQKLRDEHARLKLENDNLKHILSLFHYRTKNELTKASRDLRRLQSQPSCLPLEEKKLAPSFGSLKDRAAQELARQYQVEEEIKATAQRNRLAEDFDGMYLGDPSMPGGFRPHEDFGGSGYSEDIINVSKLDTRCRVEYGVCLIH